METTGNDACQNALAAWTEVKTFHKQQTSHTQSNTQTNLHLLNTTVRYGLHFKHTNPRMLPTKSFAHDCRCTLVRAEYGYPKGSQNTKS
jgi:hypothetical protein